MSETAAVPTLYEDWQQRREQLRASVTTMGPVHREARIRVLEHLLNQHRGKAEAAAPARFPSRPGMLLTHRAAVVHHYLGGRAALEAQNPSGIRAAVVLGRIASVHPQSSEAAKRRGAAGWQLARVKTRSVYWSSGYWHEKLLAQIGDAIQSAFSQDYVYLTVLDWLQLGPKVPDWAIMFMFERLDNPAANPEAAASLFVCCENECVLDYAVTAWRDRLAANGPDSITRGLHQVFLRPHWKEKAADKIRAELASPSLAIRIEALRLLPELGGLADLGLLLDLLALPLLQDEDTCERDAVLCVAQQLAGLDRTVALPVAVTAPRAAAVTLYEDWLQRRRRLTHLDPVQQEYVVEHRDLLGFLLERFRNAPEAGRQARFAAPPLTALFASRQAVLAYHQLGRSEMRGVVTETEAGKRALTVLRRIRSADPQASAREFAASGVMPSGKPADAQQPHAKLTTAQLQLWSDIEGWIKTLGFQTNLHLLYERIAAALALGPELPEKAVYYLSQHLDNPDAVELLGRCSSPCVLEYAFSAWCQRVTRKRKGLVRLQEFFFLPCWRDKVAEKFRRELVSAASPKVRVLAAHALSRLGTLDDIGLLSDLLCLPRWEREEPRERPALLRAMRRLGRPA